MPCTSRSRRRWSMISSGIVLVGLSWMGKIQTAQAQGIVGAPGGTGTAVTPSGAAFNITGGQAVGGNRFHSFSSFDLQSGQTANFILDATVQNVLGRVTGGAASNINGTITTSGTSTANLFLMNPAGIIFGPDARLDVGGSFTATTANGIGFGDQWFQAQGGNNYPLLTLNPTHVGFTLAQPGSIAPGSIAIGGSLFASQNLTLIAGTILSTGDTSAGGEVKLVAVNSPGRVDLVPAKQFLRADIQPLTLGPGGSPNAWTGPVVALPELLTGGGLASATGVSIVGNQVNLTSTQNPVQTGDVATTQPGGLSGNSVRVLAQGRGSFATIGSGSGGIEVSVAGQLQVLGTTSIGAADGIRVTPAQDPALSALLTSKGIAFDPNRPIPVRYGGGTGVPLPASIVARPGGGVDEGALNAPIFLRFEGASRTLIDQTRTIVVSDFSGTSTPTTQRLLVQGGEGTFSVGPRGIGTGALLPISDPYVTVEGNTLVPISPATFNPETGTLYVNQQLAEGYSTTYFAPNQSGLVGAIIQGVGTNTSVYGNVLNSNFPAVPPGGNGGGNGGGSGGGSSGGNGGGPGLARQVDGATAQPKATSRGAQTLCPPAAKQATAGDRTSDRTLDRSGNPTADRTADRDRPCIPVSEEQILRVLE
jgi:filamentous hemagglutinin family protein